MLVSKVFTFTVRDTLHLGQSPVSHAHGLAQGNVVRRIRVGMPQDHLQSHVGRSARGSIYAGCQRGRPQYGVVQQL
jgi:hypothetical protein